MLWWGKGDISKVAFARKEFYFKDKSGKGQMDIRLRLRATVNHYLDWHLLWKESEILVGIVSFLTFLDLTLTLCISFFISLTSAIDNGLGDFTTVWNMLTVLFTLLRMICLGNSANSLQEAVGCILILGCIVKCDPRLFQTSLT